MFFVLLLFLIILIIRRNSAFADFFNVFADYRKAVAEYFDISVGQPDKQPFGKAFLQLAALFNDIAGRIRTNKMCFSPVSGNAFS